MLMCFVKQSGKKIITTLVVCLFVVLTGFVMSPASAYADTRGTDIVAGQSAQVRELTAEQLPDIQSEYAIVVDKDGTVYYERNAVEPARIASMTKIMTAIVALEQAPLDTKVVVDEEAATVGESSAALSTGDTMTMETALYALMVPSGNDAAIAIAKTVGAMVDPKAEDPEAVFVDLMNQKAEELRCTDSIFENPHGLDIEKFDGNLQSTAADMAHIVAYAMSLDDFRKIVGGGDTTITVKDSAGNAKSLFLESTDELMGVYDGILGVKTGYTGDAGYCFAGAVERDGRELYTVVMNAPDSDQRFIDTRVLMDWTYQHLVEVSLAQSETHVNFPVEGENVEVPVVAQVSHTDWIDVTVPGVLADPFMTTTVFDLKGEIEQEAKWVDIVDDVAVGDIIGTLNFYQDGMLIARSDIVAAQDVEAPSFFEGVSIWWKRFIGGFSEEPEFAPSTLINEPTYA